MMQIPSEWLWPYIASNLTAFAILVVAWRWPSVARWLFAAMFLGAFYANTTLVLRSPAEYQGYDRFVLLGAYHRFITGFFADHTQPIVLAIALGQLAIGVLICCRGRLRTTGTVGAAIFLAAIVPLGVGSAFPFSVTCIAALSLMERQLCNN